MYPHGLSQTDPCHGPCGPSTVRKRSRLRHSLRSRPSWILRCLERNQHRCSPPNSWQILLLATYRHRIGVFASTDLFTGARLRTIVVTSTMASLFDLPTSMNATRMARRKILTHVARIEETDEGELIPRGRCARCAQLDVPCRRYTEEGRKLHTFVSCTYCMFLGFACGSLSLS